MTGGKPVSGPGWQLSQHPPLAQLPAGDGQVPMSGLPASAG